MIHEATPRPRQPRADGLRRALLSCCLLTLALLQPACNSLRHGLAEASADIAFDARPAAQPTFASDRDSLGQDLTNTPLVAGLLLERDKSGQGNGNTRRDPTSGGAPKVPTKRLLTYTAHLTVEAANPDEALQTCQADAESLGGFLASRNGLALTFRIPAANFEPFLSKVRALGRITHESMQVQDVTKQRRDAAIRLDNASKARARLLALLETAEKVEDVLAIEREITRLTETIESAKATLASLDDRVSYSTVTVSMAAASDATPYSQNTLRSTQSSFWWIRSVGIREVEQCF